MKKEIMFIFLCLIMLGFVSGACKLDVTMINQDPYSAVPGEYVKLVFQVDGVENPDCKEVTFELIPQYPLVFDPNTSSIRKVSSGNYKRGYLSALIATYKVRVDWDALDGDNPIDVRYWSSSDSTDSWTVEQFNLNVENVIADFEVYVKDYDETTRIITFEILNIENNDVEALTIEVPKQDNISIKGSNKNIVGDLDSNEYTTAEFEAIPKDGEISLKITYTDEIGVRRSLEKIVVFDSSYFNGRIADQTSTPWLTYIIILVVLFFVGRWIWKRRKRKHHEEKRR